MLDTVGSLARRVLGLDKELRTVRLQIMGLAEFVNGHNEHSPLNLGIKLNSRLFEELLHLRIQVNLGWYECL